MHEIHHTVAELERFFDEVAREFSAYQRAAQLPCPSECGQCCRHPDASCSPLEMYPLALAMIRDGSAEEFLERLVAGPTDLCPLFVPHPQDQTKGRCSHYAYRPLLCRMFGVAPRLKKQTIDWSVCRVLKKEHPSWNENLASLELGPRMESAMERLLHWDPKAHSEQQRISLALRVALEKLLLATHLDNAQDAENNKEFGKN